MNKVSKPLPSSFGGLDVKACQSQHGKVYVRLEDSENCEEYVILDGTTSGAARDLAKWLLQWADHVDGKMMDQVRPIIDPGDWESLQGLHSKLLTHMPPKYHQFFDFLKRTP